MITGIGESAIDVALSGLASSEEALQNAANVKLLKTAMETEKTMVNDLLESMGIGGYVDVFV